MLALIGGSAGIEHKTTFPSKLRHLGVAKLDGDFKLTPKNTPKVDCSKTFVRLGGLNHMLPSSFYRLMTIMLFTKPPTTYMD